MQLTVPRYLPAPLTRRQSCWLTQAQCGVLTFISITISCPRFVAEIPGIKFPGWRQTHYSSPKHMTTKHQIYSVTSHVGDAVWVS